MYVYRCIYTEIHNINLIKKKMRKQNLERTFLKNIQPALVIGRLFGIVFFTIKTEDDKNWRNYFDLASSVPILLCCIRLGYTAGKYANVAIYKNYNHITNITHLALYISSILGIIFRYSIYFGCRNKIRDLLVKFDVIDKSVGHCESKGDNMKKEISIFAIYSMTGLVINLALLIASSLKISSLEISFYYMLHVQIMTTDIFLVSTYLDQIRKLFLHVNRGLENLDDVNIKLLSEYCLAHENLSRMILENEDLFNVSLLSSLLPIFLMLTAFTYASTSAIMTLIRHFEVDWILYAWHWMVSVISVAKVWYVLKIRIGVKNEVSPYCIVNSTKTLFGLINYCSHCILYISPFPTIHRKYLLR